MYFLQRRCHFSQTFLSEIAVAAQKIKSARSEYDASISTVEKSVESLSVAISEISTNLNLSFEAEA